ncbi:MAG: hypothetical protein J6J23_02470 [Clostridia bacterium]|nr:hypothetical protein [Clostridia bacterium]
MKRNIDLSPKVREIFIKLGFLKLENMGKPYYVHPKAGKIYNVSEKNKLREMKDGASPKRYGHLKLKCADGKFRDVSVGRVIAGYKDNPDGKDIVGRKDGDKTNSGIDNLNWNTQSENMQRYYDNKKSYKQTEENT